MAKNDLKWKKKKAKAYIEICHNLFNAATELKMTEQEVAIKYITGEAECYISNYIRQTEEQKVKNKVT